MITVHGRPAANSTPAAPITAVWRCATPSRPAGRQRRHQELRRRRSCAGASGADADDGRAAQAGRGCGSGRAVLATGATAPPLSVQLKLIVALYEEMLEHHGLRIGLKHARKHLGWALDAAAASAGVAVDTLRRWRSMVLTSENSNEARGHLVDAYDAFAQRAAA